MIQNLPWNLTAEGKERRVGVEIEMHGLTLDRLANTAAETLSLQLQHDSRYQYRLTGDDAGDWMIEVDFRLLKEMGEVDYQAGDFADDMRQTMETLLHRVSEPFVPLELVGPSLPISRLHQFDDLTRALRHAGATGTSGNPLHAFGLQFNPEMPATDANIILRYLQAFFCLSDWLVERAQVDLARRVTSYTDPFPRPYILKVLQPNYQPDLSTLIDDYLSYNPSRNRALDLMPLFLHLDRHRVRKVTADPLIKPRPTLHYRLPNSNIHLPDWGIGKDWDDWCQVELLAADEDRLARCCTAYRNYLANPISRLLGEWTNEVEKKWLNR